jgi:hypothetical protein
VESALSFTFAAINTVFAYFEIVFSGRHTDGFNWTGACARATRLTFFGVDFVHFFSFKAAYFSFLTRALCPQLNN